MKITIKSLFAGLAFAMASTAFAANYQEVKTPQPTNLEPGKVLVQQFLWHKCIHCYDLEKYVDIWDKSKPSNVVFERIPVAWGANFLADGSYYNLAKISFKSGKITEAQLNEINQQLFDISFVSKQELNQKTAFPIFKNYKIASTEDEFSSLLNSFVVSTEKMRAEKLTKAYDVKGVPVFVIDGKYFFGFDLIKEGDTPAVIFKAINEYAKSKEITPEPTIATEKAKEESVTVSTDKEAVTQ